MRWGGRLTFPILYPIEGSLTENLSENINLGMPPVVFPDFETNGILDTLQTISFVMEIPNISLGDKKAISDAVYNTEHELLSMEYAHGESNAYKELESLLFHTLSRSPPFSTSKSSSANILSSQKSIIDSNPSCMNFWPTMVCHGMDLDRFPVGTFYCGSCSSKSLLHHQTTGETTPQ
jgi:hypothetical protein